MKLQIKNFYYAATLMIRWLNHVASLSERGFMLHMQFKKWLHIYRSDNKIMLCEDWTYKLLSCCINYYQSRNLIMLVSHLCCVIINELTHLCCVILDQVIDEYTTGQTANLYLDLVWQEATHTFSGYPPGVRIVSFSSKGQYFSMLRFYATMTYLKNKIWVTVVYRPLTMVWSSDGCRPKWLITSIRITNLC